MGTGKSWAHTRIWQREGAESGGSRVIDIGARRIISHALSKTKWGPDWERKRVENTAIVICGVRKPCACGIFPMVDRTGMECCMSHPLVKPIWQPKAGNTGGGCGSSEWASSACFQELLRAGEGPFPTDTSYSFSRSASWHWVTEGHSIMWHTLQMILQRLTLPSVNFKSSWEKQRSAEIKTVVSMLKNDTSILLKCF